MAGLLKYVTHDAGCMLGGGTSWKQGDGEWCSCGLADAIRQLADAIRQRDEAHASLAVEKQARMEWARKCGEIRAVLDAAIKGGPP